MVSRNLFTVLAVLVLALALLPAVAQPDPQASGLRVTVQLDDGTPCGNVPVVIKLNGEELAMATDADGVLAFATKAGNGTIALLGQEAPVKVTAGGFTPVNIKLKPRGVLVTLRYADKEHGDPQCSANYRNGDGTLEVPVLLLGKDRLLLYGVPETAKDVSLAGAIPAADDRGSGLLIDKHWTFDKAEPLRAVTLDIPHIPRLSVKVVDEDGHPLVNAHVSATLTMNNPAAVRLSLNRLTIDGVTDANGLVDLGAWSPGAYTLHLQAKTGMGKVVPVTLAADGTSNIDHYTILTKLRAITQTVFTAAGKPAPRATVTASCAWLGQLILKQATADDQGRVTWTEMPPSRVIVWGPDVPAGVIGEDETNITKPLPAPVPGASVYLHFALPPQEKPAQPLDAEHSLFTCKFLPESGQESDLDLENENDAIGNVTSGTRFSLLGFTASLPRRSISLLNIYVPYVLGGNDEGNPLTYTLTTPLPDAAVVHLSFTTKDGKAVPGVSRVTAISRNPALRALLRRSGLVTVELGADGGYLLTSPLPGDYTLLVDLFDEAVPAERLPVVTAKAGNSACTVALPDPLFTAPGGTELSWVTPRRPSTPRHCVVAPLAAEMPVFGPRESLLGVWGLARPDQLLLFTAKDAKTQFLPLRIVTLDVLSFFDANITPTLAPLLPVPYALADATEEHPLLHTERIKITFYDISINRRLFLWPSSYLILGDERGPEALLTVPWDAPPGKTIKVTPDNHRIHQSYRSTKLLLPAIDAAVRKKAAPVAAISYDVDGPGATYQLELNENVHESWIEVPVSATRISVRWLGVGSVIDAPLPRFRDGEEAPVVTLPDFTAGATVTGVVNNVDGTPLRSGQLNVLLANAATPDQTFYVIATDAQGRFAISNVPEGLLEILPADTDGGWMLNVPKTGLANVTLRLVENPTRLGNLDASGEARIAWWKPDGGAPRRVLCQNNGVVGMDLPAGPCELWLAGLSGSGRYLRTILRAEPMDAPAETEDALSPSLGITFPFSPDLRMPRAVTLTGTGPWNGVVVRYQNMFWQACPALGLIVGQIDAVPPGDWQVRVEVPGGVVEKTVTVTETGAALALEFPK